MLLDKNQVAERLGVSPRMAYELMRQMTVVRIGKRFRVSEESLNTWIQQNTLQPASNTVKPISRKPRLSVLDGNGKIPLRKKAG